MKQSDNMKKKVLLVDVSALGHHDTYINALVNLSDGYDFYAIYPKILQKFKNVYKLTIPMEKKHFSDYVRFLKLILKVANEISPDIIHILSGDYFYRFFGYGLLKISKKSRLVITFHHTFDDNARKFSIKCIAKRCDRIVVHTKTQKDELNRLGLFNINVISYPNFNHKSKLDVQFIREKLKISSDSVVLAAIGATRYDKRLDILLNALNHVNANFSLIIAGELTDFSREFIDSNIVNYKSQVVIIPRYLEDHEMADVIKASDYIVLPYRKKFNGASGPLAEGIDNGKIIIAPNHGSLNDTVVNNHLGYTFVSEDSNDLSRVIDLAINTKFQKDELYEAFKKNKSSKYFKMRYLELYEELCNN